MEADMPGKVLPGAAVFFKETYIMTVDRPPQTPTHTCLREMHCALAMHQGHIVHTGTSLMHLGAVICFCFATARPQLLCLHRHTLYPMHTARCNQLVNSRPHIQGGGLGLTFLYILGLTLEKRKENALTHIAGPSAYSPGRHRLQSPRHTECSPWCQGG